MANDQLLVDLGELIKARTGLYFTEQTRPQLIKALTDAAGELHLQDADALAQHLLQGNVTQDTIDLLARHLTVGETYFFREPAALKVYAQQMLPELIAARRATTRRLRIWSAACCTGEEPYTLAMILRGVLPNWREWDPTIIGTDINKEFLARAVQGVYREWSFRAMPPDKRELYFTTTDSGLYKLNSDIRAMVGFSYLNLAEPYYPALATNTNNIDIIFCRNVLIYLSAETSAEVARRFYNALNPGGWLVVSPSEASATLFADFETLSFPGAIIYRKPLVAKSAPGTGPLGQPDANGRSAQANNQQPFIPSNVLKRASQPTFTATKPLSSISQQRGGAWRAPLEPSKVDPVDFAARARAAADQGKLDEALSWCRAAIEADKIEPRYHYLYATILLEQGMLDKAVAALRSVLFLDPSFIAAYFALGNLSIRASRIAEARKHLNTALSLLALCSDDDIVPEMDGMTVRRVTLLVASITAGLDDEHKQ